MGCRAKTPRRYPPSVLADHGRTRLSFFHAHASAARGRVHVCTFDAFCYMHLRLASHDSCFCNQQGLANCVCVLTLMLKRVRYSILPASVRFRSQQTPVIFVIQGQWPWTANLELSRLRGCFWRTEHCVLGDPVPARTAQAL
jgi:hypothetical protein